MRAASSAALGGLGLAVIAVLAVGIAGTTSAPAAPVATADDEELVVAMHVPAAGLRAGAVRGGEIVAATGLEADVARAIARRLGARSLRIVAVADPGRLARAGALTWDLALGGITVEAAGTTGRRLAYLSADPVVLMRPGLARPRSLADLRPRVLCAVRGSRGARVARQIHPVFRPLDAPSEVELVRMTAAGRCDAAIGDAPLIGTTVQRLGGRHGHIGGRIDAGERWVAAVPRASTVGPAVERALRRLRADGTLARIAERWLGFDPAALRVLR
jgi:ABC-type amino acid transport substrate-binding protein